MSRMKLQRGWERWISMHPNLLNHTFGVILQVWFYCTRELDPPIVWYWSHCINSVYSEDPFKDVDIGCTVTTTQSGWWRWKHPAPLWSMILLVWLNTTYSHKPSCCDLILWYSSTPLCQPPLINKPAETRECTSEDTDMELLSIFNLTWGNMRL